MSIKKSSLERKWYYRVVKVFFLILPLLVALFLFLSGKVNIPEISQKNISDVLQKNIVYIIYIIVGVPLYYLILRGIWKGFLYIIFGGLEDDIKKEGGGAVQSVSSVAQKPKTAEIIPIIILVCILTIAVLFQMGYIKLPKINIGEDHQYGASCTGKDGKNGLYGTDVKCYTCSDNGKAVTNPTGNCSDGIAGVYCCTPGEDKDDRCIPTGCSPGWYCSGSYYIGGQQINVPGLCFPTHPRNIYPDWVGTCRQCP